MESVDLIASGYEWICPECDFLNKEIEYNEQVKCSNSCCQKDFKANFPDHCFG